MSTHTCFVCRQGGIVTPGELHIGETDDGILLLAQCPTCWRFICSRHAEVVTPATRHHFPDGTPATLAHCPFDAGVPLGQTPPRTTRSNPPATG